MFLLREVAMRELRPTLPKFIKAYVNGQNVAVRAGNLIQVLKVQISAETKGHSFIWSSQPESSDTGFPWGAQRLDFDHCWASHSLTYFLSIACQVEYDTLHAAKTHFLLACSEA